MQISVKNKLIDVITIFVLWAAARNCRGADEPRRSVVLPAVGGLYQGKDVIRLRIWQSAHPSKACEKSLNNSSWVVGSKPTISFMKIATLHTKQTGSKTCSTKFKTCSTKINFFEFHIFMSCSKEKTPRKVSPCKPIILTIDKQSQ